MEQIYIFMLAALFALAIADLIVGVSNDAVNFLNSAVGSKAFSLKTIMIVAAVGIAIGAIFSSGMMEVARKGIFNPSQFNFDEIMVIFMAVMITDILLLDLFNSMGLPTSTTVSIVFELLGASVCIAVLKILNADLGFNELANYINTQKATEIIFGIIISVAIAFSVGAVVQYISRLIFSFKYEKRLKYIGGIFGGVSITAITYFILIKGLKGISFIPGEWLTWVNENTFLLITISFIFWTIFSQLIISVFKWNILKIIVIVGTFALAMAFAGNDLVNFIGVPIAAWQSFDLWQPSGMAPEAYSMGQLSGAVKTPSMLLLLAGIIMVITLLLSKKARHVAETEIKLSSQGDTKERFQPNLLSRLIVRGTINLNGALTAIIPTSIREKIENRFEKPVAKKKKGIDEPAFDLLRASINLVVASILIAIGTSLKLPLSTTYVTFMVAMGTSLADRAWGRDSAVYRVAGVFNVIGGWFVTALVAFVAAAIFAFIIFKGKVWAVAGLLILAVILLIRSFVIYRNREREKKNSRKFEREDVITINEIVLESSDNISRVLGQVNSLYTSVVDNLGLHDLNKLKKCKKKLGKLDNEVDELKNELFYFIKSLDETSVEASKFYILVLDYLQDMVQSIGYIVKNSYNHVNNNHKNLKFNQIRDLKGIDRELEVLFSKIKKDFDDEFFSNIEDVLGGKKALQDHVSTLIQKQIERIRSTETSPKNTKLYFGLLLETKDLITATMNLLELFRDFHRDYKSYSS
ncbi:inorganic phosphate transporter [Abyssalbus ytuae]|uniref:Phosphate transporter n=1 Tax=Abyssalbus ytuae TaxID=2926907 RepID=A0A9E6ZN71_9FLAO|nr:inorganic phosphate transporter [Abyssalbus ytuae]UOB18962.1 inorganic phosphate transporter [Abyssalbus ytuae]